MRSSEKEMKNILTNNAYLLFFLSLQEVLQLLFSYSSY